MFKMGYSRQEVRRAVCEALEEYRLRNTIKQYIREEILREEEEASNMKRSSVMASLRDDKFNHAELMRQLWHPKDKSEEDTYRSLFSKMATGKPDADGNVRKFSDDEINKLYQMIRTKN